MKDDDINMNPTEEIGDTGPKRAKIHALSTSDDCSLFEGRLLAHSFLPSAPFFSLSSCLSGFGCSLRLECLSLSAHSGEGKKVTAKHHSLQEKEEEHPRSKRD